MAAMMACSTPTTTTIAAVRSATQNSRGRIARMRRMPENIDQLDADQEDDRRQNRLGHI